MATQRKMVVEEHVVRLLRLNAEVTEYDINDGTPCKPQDCMLKLAIERTLRAMPGQKNRHHYVVVKNGIATWSYESRRYRAVLPANAVRAYLAFDKGKGGDLKPFNVKLKGQDVGPVIKATRVQKDKLNEKRRLRYASGHRQKEYTLHDRIAGTAEPAGRPLKKSA